MKTMSQKIILVGMAAWALGQAVGAADLGTKRTLTLEIAKSMTAAAEKKAMDNKWAMVVAILDDGGNLLQLDRMDGAPIGSVEVAQQKAHTAVIFKSPSKDFADGLAKGTTALLKLNVLPFEGGIPLVVDGQVIGAIGVSGGTAEQDGTVAKAGADWFAANTKSKK